MIVGSIALCLQSCNQQVEIGSVLGRPWVPQGCISNGDGSCFRAGIRVPTKNMNCTEDRYVVDIEGYLLDIELQLYKCRKDSKKCPRL